MRLFEHLRSLGLSNAEAHAALRSGKVRLNGVPTADGGREVGGFTPDYNPRAPRLNPGRDLALVWSDPHLAVVWKPPGLLSTPAPGRGRDPDVLGAVARLKGAALAVHRLDQDTSGLMAVALRPGAQTALKDLLEQHAVERRYLALVQGQAPERPLELRSHLVRDRGDGLRGSIERWPHARDPGSAKEAHTSLRLVERLPRGVSLVELTLHTGRTHQARVHLAEAALPVLGDPLYATQGITRKAPRLALHAAVLGFTHPVTGEALRFEAPLADDLERLRRGLLEGNGAAQGA